MYLVNVTEDYPLKLNTMHLRGGMHLYYICIFFLLRCSSPRKKRQLKNLPGNIFSSANCFVLEGKGRKVDLLAV